MEKWMLEGRLREFFSINQIQGRTREKGVKKYAGRHNLEAPQGKCSLLTKSDEHEGRGHSKGQGVALGLSEARGRPEDGGQDSGNHRPKVDGCVEDVEE